MAQGRPIEFDRNVAVAQATGLFWRKGFKATSLHDLLAVTGLSKSSFYQSFNSKNELFQRCLERYSKDRLNDIIGLRNEADNAREFFNLLVLGVAREAHGKKSERIGCLLMNTACELAQRDPQISSAVAASLEQVVEFFEAEVRHGQQNGDITSTIPARSLAQYLLASIGGLRNMVKAGADESTCKKIAEVTLKALD